jgi:hypothetical protein
MSKIHFNGRWWSAIRLALFGACAGLMIWGAPGLVWGAGKKPTPVLPPQPKSYTMMYMATILVVAGGVAIVCLPSRRKKEVD